MKKNRAIVFTLTCDLAFAAACVMIDIKKLSPALADEVVIIHDGISKKSQHLLNSILPSRFIVYDFPIKDTAILNQGTLNYFTKLVFAKFECLKLLNEYRNVMLLDYDIVLQQDISELFESCQSGARMMPGGLKVRGQLHEPVDDYDMEAEGICASTFVFQDHLKDYMKMYEFCYEGLKKYAKSLYMPEQAIFDFMIQEYDLRICPIDRKIYSPHQNDKELIADAKIIHAYGQPKFWNGLNNEHWNANYQMWVRMGGNRYQRLSVKKIIQRLETKIKSLNMIRGNGNAT